MAIPVTEAQKAQHKEFFDMVFPVLEKHAQAVHEIFVATMGSENTSFTCFSKTGVRNSENALFELFDQYEELVKSKQHTTQCIRLKAVIDDVMKPIIEYQKKYGIAANYTRSDYLAEIADALKNNCSSVLGLDHARYKSTITRPGAVMWMAQGRTP